MAKKRVRQVEATSKQPRQSIAGYYPASWTKIPANARHKEVTAEEALQALSDEPGARGSDVRIYVYGVHESYRAGQDNRFAEVLASKQRRGPLTDTLEAIKADKQAYRAQLEVDTFQEYMGRHGGRMPDKKGLSLMRRRITEVVNRYEQGLLVDLASDTMGHPYSRVLGIWVAS